MCMEEATLREGTAMPRASIVIPCYNAHKFIRQTLASALAQSMSDLEVICINNNSADDTRQILDEFAARDPRVRVFDEPTPGEGPARQAGLARATGDWLYFLDSDDLMEPQLLEHAIACGEKNAVDFVIFNTYTLNDRTGEVLSSAYG